jgi:hypothetical protein
VTGQHPQARERIASAVQYVMLGGFAATAAGISAQGLTGFARSDMELRGPWPYLLFFALDGAAGVCAVLMARRAARAEPGLAPRLAVWGLVAASASFNWAHAPRRSAAPEAYSLMPVIAALLFEFCLREMRQRTAGRADRRLDALRWLRPAELVRVRKHLAADAQMSAEDATRQVRVSDAARRLYQLRVLLLARGREDAPAGPGERRVRRAERRAYRALIRAGFTESAVAFAVLRQVQVMTQTRTLAILEYGTADAARAAIGNLISSPAAAPAPGDESDPGQPGLAGAAGTGITAPEASAQPASVNGHRPGGEPAAGQPPGPARDTPAAAVIAAVPGPEASHPGDDADGGEEELVAAARRLIAEARQAGARISQIALAEKLRSEGYKVANNRLRWLAAVSGMEPGQDGEPGTRSGAGRS